MTLRRLKVTATWLLFTAIATLVLLLIAACVLRSAQQGLDWPAHLAALQPYLRVWRALFYSSIVTVWIATLRRRLTQEDQHRLKRLGLIGFGTLLLVECARA